jgi:serine/threonine protein phosphatase PrpC
MTAMSCENAVLPLCWAAATDIGRIRPENEDAFAEDPEIGLFVVSDGMGGHAGGAVASQVVVDVLPRIVRRLLGDLKTYTPSPRTIKRLLKAAILELNEQMLIESAAEKGLREMGATVVATLFVEDRCYAANIGDSRIYLLRSGSLSQLSLDHSVASELARLGRIEPEETANHPEGHLLTQCIGMDTQAIAHVRSVTLKQADRILLCTDGLTSVIDNQTITRILEDNADSGDACDALIAAANNAGGPDNTTVIVLDWFE